MPTIATRLALLATEPDSSGSAEFLAFFRADLDRWGEVIRAADIKLE